MQLSEFQETLRSDPKPVLVEFWAPWCGPCRMMAPSLDRLGKQYADQVTLHKINADQNPELLRAWNVMAIPTMLVFEGGELVQRRTGAQTPQALSDLFANLGQGQTRPVPLPAPAMDSITRMLRLLSGLMLILLAMWTETWLLFLIGGLIAFWGWYDRCPVWQMVAPRLRKYIEPIKRT